MLSVRIVYPVRFIRFIIEVDAMEYKPIRNVGISCDFMDKSSFNMLKSASALYKGYAIVGGVGARLLANAFAEEAGCKTSLLKETLISSGEIDMALLGMHSGGKKSKMSDNIHVTLGNRMSEVRIRESPFYVINNGDQYIDIFDTSTGIGPIPVDKTSLGDRAKITLDGIDLELALPGTILATHLNPIASRNKSRLLRGVVLFAISGDRCRDREIHGAYTERRRGFIFRIREKRPSS